VRNPKGGFLWERAACANQINFYAFIPYPEPRDVLIQYSVMCTGVGQPLRIDFVGITTPPAEMEESPPIMNNSLQSLQSDVHDSRFLTLLPAKSGLYVYVGQHH